MPKTALITTTIGVPTVLRTYRAIAGYDLGIYVAGDERTPHEDVARLCAELGSARYLHPREQEARWPQLSACLGWRSIQRRNIALLEAVHDGADVIITIDDDNEPLDAYWLQQMRRPIPLAGPGPAVATTGTAAFNIGDLATPRYFTRGYPWQQRQCEPAGLTFRSQRRTGIVQGLIYGNVDLGAVDRAVAPDGRLTYSELVTRDGVWTPPGHYAPINTQNTAFVRELAPAMAVIPGCGRYDDIWAGYLAQRVGREHGYGVMFGGGIVYQARHPHNVWRDIEGELFGNERTSELLELLDSVPLERGRSVLDDTAAVWSHLQRTERWAGWRWQVSPQRFSAYWLEAIAAALDGRTMQPQPQYAVNAREGNG